MEMLEQSIRLTLGHKEQTLLTFFGILYSLPSFGFEAHNPAMWLDLFEKDVGLGYRGM